MVKIIQIIAILLVVIAALFIGIIYLIYNPTSTSIGLIGVFGTLGGAVIASTISLSVERTRRLNKYRRDHLREIQNSCLNPLKYNIGMLGSDDGYLFINEGRNFMTPQQVDEHLSAPVHTWSKGEGGVDFRVFIGTNFPQNRSVDKKLYEDLSNHQLNGIKLKTKKVKEIYSRTMPLHFKAYKRLYTKIKSMRTFTMLSSMYSETILFQVIFFQLYNIGKGYWPNIYKQVEKDKGKITTLTQQIERSVEYKRFKEINDRITKAKREIVYDIDEALDAFSLNGNCRFLQSLDF